MTELTEAQREAAGGRPMSGEGGAVPVVMCWCIPGSPVVPVTLGHRKSARRPEMPRARVTPPTETEEGGR